MEKWMIPTSRVLTFFGLLVSLYMTVFKITNNEGMCLGSGGCSILNNSIYSEVYGIPVALVGVIGYSTLLVALIKPIRKKSIQQNSM